MKEDLLSFSVYPKGKASQAQRVGIIIQARTGSSRLPGKVLKPLPCSSSDTVLSQVIRRCKKSITADLVVVATTTKKEDDTIVEIAEKEGVEYFRGEEKDVLSRYYNAAKHFDIDIVVRITSDCPCIDPQVIDKIVIEHLKYQADYTSNTLERTFPHGLDVEVISFKALEEAYKNAKDPYEREHVCPYIHTTNRNKFKCLNITVEEPFRAPDIRITLDTLDDYILLCVVYDYLYPQNPYFGLKEIVRLFKEKPWLKLINRRVVQKRKYSSLKEELKEALKILELQELFNAKEILQDCIKKSNF